MLTSPNVWKTFTNSPSTLTLCLLQNITCVDWTIYSWQGSNSLGCPLMLRTNNRCVQSINISVDVAKCLENIHKFTQFTHFLSVPKNYMSWLNNLFMARFQLNSMSTYVKNKLQMCSVTQHQCRCRQMCGKCSHINLLHSLLYVILWLVLNLWTFSTHLATSTLLLSDWTHL